MSLWYSHGKPRRNPQLPSKKGLWCWLQSCRIMMTWATKSVVLYNEVIPPLRSCGLQATQNELTFDWSMKKRALHLIGWCFTFDQLLVSPFRVKWSPCKSDGGTRTTIWKNSANYEVHSWLHQTHNGASFLSSMFFQDLTQKRTHSNITRRPFQRERSHFPGKGIAVSILCCRATSQISKRGEDLCLPDPSSISLSGLSQLPSTKKWNVKFPTRRPIRSFYCWAVAFHFQRFSLASEISGDINFVDFWSIFKTHNCFE